MKGYRVAVVGPATPLGQRIRETLEERAFPIGELKLFEAADASERRLTEFEGDILVTEPVDPDLFSRLDLLFFAASAEESHVKAAVREGVLTFVFGDSTKQGTLVALGVNEKALAKEGRLVRAPRPVSTLLGTTLSALAQKFALETACATVAVPALTLGKQGLEELQQQTVNVLSFKSPATRVFGQQLAFNLTLAPPSDVEGIGREAAEIAGQSFPVAVSLVRAPIFTAYAASLWVSIAGRIDVDAVRAALRTSKRVQFHEGETPAKPAPSPLSVVTLDKVHVARIRPEADGFWMWLVADMTAVDPAVHSVRLAEKILAVPARRK